MFILQVMGSLAAEKPEHGKPLSGILIKRGFNYHLIGPDDLQSKSANKHDIHTCFLFSDQNSYNPLSQSTEVCYQDHSTKCSTCTFHVILCRLSSACHLFSCYILFTDYTELSTSVLKQVWYK